MSRGLGYCSVLTLLCACGANTAPAEPTTFASQGGERRQATYNDELSVTGLRGTLSQDEIRNVLEPRLLKFSRCVERRSSEVEWISGTTKLSFHIAVDGSVASVFPSASDMGDRETERCLLGVAKSVRFPAPHGGEAEFAWPLEVPLDEDIREPVAWDAIEANDTLLTHSQAALEACGGGGGFSITAYVDPDGRVLAAGGSVPDVSDADKLDCISEAVKAWTFHSPGSYPAKVSFVLR